MIAPSPLRAQQHNTWRIKETFEQALEIEAVDERQAWLEQVCADQPELCSKIDVLLQARDKADSFLQVPVLATVACEPVPEKVGSVIGLYKLGDRSAKAVWASSISLSSPNPCAAGWR